jgi:phosphoglycolate phosphatase
LLDTLADLANSMNAVLSCFGFLTHPIDSYRYFIGDGADCLVRRSLPKDRLDDGTVGKSLAALRDEYGKRWAENTKPYPGIPELLSALQERKIPMTVLSNKPDEFTQITVKKLLPDWSFHIVRGVRPSVAKKPNPAAALDIARELQISPCQFVYLGDTDTDMQTAESAGMYAAGALWGFRTTEELLANGAKILLKKPQEVLSLFDDNRKTCSTKSNYY